MDLITIVENETRGYASSTPWVKAAWAVSELSDAINSGHGIEDAMAAWDERSAVLLEVLPDGMSSLRREIGSTTWYIQSLLQDQNYIDAHRLLQRQFRMILQGICSLELPQRITALVRLASEVWLLVETAADRDVSKFLNISSKLNESAEQVAKLWGLSNNSIFEPVLYWSNELARISALLTQRRSDSLPENLFQAVSNIKSALIALHQFITTNNKQFGK